MKFNTGPTRNRFKTRGQAGTRPKSAGRRDTRQILSTHPWLPVFPGTAVTGSVGSVSSNRIPAGSVITIALATDSSGNVTGATFSIADPNGNVQSGSTKPWSDYAGQTEPPEYALFPIYGFQLDMSSAPGLPVMFTSGAGTLTYSVSSGALSVQTTNTCGGIQPGTAENSNIVYQAVTPASGPTLTQAFAAPAMGMDFLFDKSTFGQDEVTQTSTWGLAYWLAISGLWRQWLEFEKPADLNGPPNPAPTITAAISGTLNPGLTAVQIATIANNLPVVNTLARRRSMRSTTRSSSTFRPSSAPSPSRSRTSTPSTR